MLLMSVLLAAVTFNPALAPRPATEGIVEAQAISPDVTCKPGVICAKLTVTGKHNNCFFTNIYNGSVGGTPLTVDVSQSGPQGSPVYLYWVNATNLDITILGGKTRAYVNCL